MREKTHSLSILKTSVGMDSPAPPCAPLCLQCPVCKRSFVNKSSLRNHQDTAKHFPYAALVDELDKLPESTTAELVIQMRQKGFLTADASSFDVSPETAKEVLCFIDDFLFLAVRRYQELLQSVFRLSDAKRDELVSLLKHDGLLARDADCLEFDSSMSDLAFRTISCFVRTLDLEQQQKQLAWQLSETKCAYLRMRADIEDWMDKGKRLLAVGEWNPWKLYWRNDSTGATVSFDKAHMHRFEDDGDSNFGESDEEEEAPQKRSRKNSTKRIKS